MTTEGNQLQGMLAQYAVPLQVWLAPTVREATSEVLTNTLGRLARVITDPIRRAHELTGPAVMVIGPEDIQGPHCETLLELAEQARPGRPVLLGGTTDRDTLLDAINRWRVFKVVAADAAQAVLIAAVQEAGTAMEREVAMNNAIDDLHAETGMLDAAISHAEANQDQSAEHERLSTMGRVTEGLAAAFEREGGHLTSLELPPDTADPEISTRDDVQFALDGFRSISTLLDEMKEYAEHRERTNDTSPEPLDEIVTRAIELCHFDRLARDRNIAVNLNSNAWVTVGRYRIMHLTIHLLRAALKATGPGASIDVSTHVDGDFATVEITDAATEVPTSVRARLLGLDPTGRAQGVGALQATRDAIESRGGHVSCDDRADGGTRTRIVLPAASPPPSAPDPSLSS